MTSDKRIEMRLRVHLELMNKGLGSGLPRGIASKQAYHEVLRMSDQTLQRRYERIVFDEKVAERMQRES